MRWVRFDEDRLGLVDGDDVIDMSALAGPAGRAGRLHAALASGALEAADPAAAGARRPLSSVRLLAPLGQPGKIVAAPVNYLAHKAEMNETRSIAEYGVFLKAPSSIVGPGETVQLPYTDVLTEQEGELAIVIGRRASRVPRERALDVVFGYTCLLDVTVRSTEDRSTRKSFDTFTPIGPWVTTRDAVGDPDDLRLRCWVDGELRQDVSTAELIFDVRTLVAYASSVMTLEPGDVVATGTPAGVGPLAAGDAIVVEVERVGRLEVAVADDHAIPYADRPRPPALAGGR